MKKTWQLAAVLLLAAALCLSLAACGAGGGTEAAESGAELTVQGDGVESPAVFSLGDLQDLDTQTLTYSTLNNYPSLKYAKAEGCSLAAVLAACGLKDEAAVITVSADDGFSQSFRAAYLLGELYFYDLAGNPNPVETILAWAYSDNDGSVPAEAEPQDSLRLVFGQYGPHDPNSSSSVRGVTTIEVSCAAPEQLAPCDFQLTDEGLVEFVYEGMDGVKLYYTTDGSDPDPLVSEVYNPSASNFQPELNAPLDLAPGTKLRVKAVSASKLDSEVSEYEVQ